MRNRKDAEEKSLRKTLMLFFHAYLSDTLLIRVQ